LPGDFTDFATCRTCGLIQLPENTLRCRKCGDPLFPLTAYRKNEKGEWEQIEDLDLSSHIPKRIPLRQRIPWYRWSLLLAVSLLPGGLIWGWSLKLQQDVAREQADTAAYRAAGIGLYTLALTATIERNRAGKLIVNGTTNLPDGTVLEARILRGATVLAQDFPILVQGKNFHSAELANRGRPFAPGEYGLELLVRFEPTSQPQSVFDIVGPGGVKLRGLHVREEDSPGKGKTVFFQGTVSLR